MKDVVGELRGAGVVFVPKLPEVHVELPSPATSLPQFGERVTPDKPGYRRWPYEHVADRPTLTKIGLDVVDVARGDGEMAASIWTEDLPLSLGDRLCPRQRLVCDFPR